MASVKNKLPVIGLLLGTILLVFLILFLVKKETLKLSADQDKLGVLNADLTNLDNLEKDYKERGKDLEKVKSTFPSTYDDVLDYSVKLDSIASGLFLNPEIRFDKDSKKETSGVESLGVSIKVDGQYPQLLNFVGKITNLPYHIYVTDLEIRKGEGVTTLELGYKLYVNFVN